MNSIHVDALSFTLPIADLRHLPKGVTRGKNGFSKKASSLLNPKFPVKPQLPSFSASSHTDVEDFMADSRAVVMEYYEEMLQIFTDVVLGFYLSPLRGRGFHGYTDSMTLYSYDNVEVGYLGIGGNRDTIHFQISGTGCKYLFGYRGQSNEKQYRSHTSHERLHYWLHDVLEITHLSRVDLAYDCFDDNFNCEYAELAYVDGAFRKTDANGSPVGRNPKIAPRHEYVLGQDGKTYSQEMVCVGSRSSTTYWRIYNKKLEQGIKQQDFTWHRSEVELKKWDINCLLDLAGTFSHLCDFAASICDRRGQKTKSILTTKTAEQKACLDMVSRVRWIKQFAGNAIADVLATVDGDACAALGLLLPDNSTNTFLQIPPSHKQLINNAIGANHGY